jgi:hypothetical protein
MADALIGMDMEDCAAAEIEAASSSRNAETFMVGRIIAEEIGRSCGLGRASGVRIGCVSSILAKKQPYTTTPLVLAARELNGKHEED